MRTIYVTKMDLERLRGVILDAVNAEYRGSDYIKDLKAELDRAVVVDSKEVPPDVITMNSTVNLVDNATGEEITLTLVYPQDSDPGKGKVSILAPIGTAILGYRVGDTIEWNVPDGVNQFTVKEIKYQPEAAGDYEL